MDHFYDPLIEAAYFAGQRSVTYNNATAFMQTELDTRYLNVTAGGRYDHHSRLGGSFVPRLALTKIWDIFHVKGLFSQAFRTPNFEVINAAPLGMPQLTAEKTTVGELEFGVTPSKQWFLAANVFLSKIDRPIVYDVVTTADGTLVQGYFNTSSVTNAGGEVEARARYTWGYATLSYSVYRILKSDIRIYEVPGHEHTSLAIPTHKVALNSSINIAKGLSLNPSAALYSERYGYVRDTSAAVGTWANRIARFKPELLLNGFLRYEIYGFSFGLGAYDILNVRHRYIQPYDGGGAPLPGRGREFLARVGYDWKF
jgi:outer membrane receptor protein involved in Fe transport